MKTRYGADDLAELFDGSSKVYAAKGKKLTELKYDGSDEALEELSAVALGPTGNLRAPTVRAGKTWIVGFNEDLYADRL